jgi:NifU-like protein involved in Fe-S cluster formation
MVGSRLRDVMLAGEGAGTCTGPDVATGRGEHPVCGDVVELSVRLRPDTRAIDEVRWRASGCPASMAVAALAAKVLRSVPTAAAEATLRTAIAEHGGLALHERHAETIVLRALAAATGTGTAPGPGGA